MNKQTDKILQIVKGFREGVMGDLSSNSRCFMVCYSLVGYLNFSGYQCNLIQGCIGDWEHFWIKLPDGSIIDPTADQFNCPDGSPMPQIYYGDKPKWYEVS